MTATIKITVCGSFQENNGRLFASLLRRLARLSETKSFEFGYVTPLKDADGNVIGKFEVEQ